MTTTSFAKTVWDKLFSVNVNEHTEKKGQLNYLSWAWAWGVLMEYYPESEYTLLDDVTMPNGTVECRIELTVREGDNSITRMMWLPVMDYKNKAMSNPDAVAINKTRMRCLAKAIAMFGLGHYIYAGEDLPTADDHQQAQQSSASTEQKAQYPDEQLNSNIEAWSNAIKAGKTTPDNLIKKISTQYILTPQQIGQIRGLAQ